uniref:Uncharacterized protein n=1 Tax=Kalanchoe fedtschenkoi TaxID=63787 RepID=A0A7N0VKQ4_KALFE
MVAMRLIRRLERVGFIYKMALKLVAVLLWLQLAAEIPEVLNIVLSADDEAFSAMINEAENILRFISNPALDLASLGVSRLETLVSSRNGSLTITGLLTERDRVRASVDENYRMLLKGKKVVTEEDDDMENMEFGSIRYVGQYSHQAAGQRGGVNLRYGNHGPNYSPGQSSSSSTFATLEQNLQTRLNPAAQAFIPIVAVNRGTEEERCLYLTFSNGYPLTSSEIATFFREMCETVGGWRHNPRAVETVYVHQGEDGVALFGKVVFCNPYLPNFFLGRQNEVKFILHGRALWCKRFVPKSIRSNLVGSTQGESSRAGGLRFRGVYQT